ncbi:hypothetical protein VPH35_130521 [Triticum aestivum]
MSGRRPWKAVPVDCAGRDGAVDVGAAAPEKSLWQPDFCGNDDGGSDVGDAAMVAVVGSSPACPRYCLGLFVAVESKLRWRGPVVYDDWLQVARSVIFRGASRAWFCSSEFSVRVGAALSGCRLTCCPIGWALPNVFQSRGVGLALVVPVFAQFSVINWAILFCLINR